MKKKMTPSVVFAERLKRARQASGLTQEAVAQLMAVDRTTYTKYESGRVEPSLQMAYALSRLFRVSLDDLLKEE